MEIGEIIKKRLVKFDIWTDGEVAVSFLVNGIAESRGDQVKVHGNYVKEIEVVSVKGYPVVVSANINGSAGVFQNVMEDLVSFSGVAEGQSLKWFLTVDGIVLDTSTFYSANIPGPISSVQQASITI